MKTCLFTWFATESTWDWEKCSISPHTANYKLDIIAICLQTFFRFPHNSDVFIPVKHSSLWQIHAFSAMVHLPSLLIMQVIDEATTVMWKGQVCKIYCSADAWIKTNTQTKGCCLLPVMVLFPQNLNNANYLGIMPTFQLFCMDNVYYGAVPSSTKDWVVLPLLTEIPKEMHKIMF